MSKKIASKVTNAEINLGPLIGVVNFPVKFNIAAELMNKQNNTAASEPSTLPIVKVTKAETISNRLSEILSSKSPGRSKNVVLRFNKQTKKN